MLSAGACIAVLVLVLLIAITGAAALVTAGQQLDSTASRCEHSGCTAVARR
jgi:hypothetical protein